MTTEERLRRIKELREKVADLDKQKEDIRIQEKNLDEEEYKIGFEEVLEQGLVYSEGESVYIDKAKCRITITIDEILWEEMNPDTRILYDVKYDVGRNSYGVKQGVLKQRMKTEAWEKATNSTKFLAKMVRFKELRKYDSEMLMGITARGKMILFKHHHTPVNDSTYYIAASREMQRYELRRKGSRYWDNYGSIGLIGHFDTEQEILEFLL